MRTRREQGIYDIPYEEYRRSEGIANSDLSLVSRTLAHYKFKQDLIEKGEESEDETEAKFLGSLFHELILEPQKNSLKNFSVKPEGMKFNTKEGKDWLARQGGREVITVDQQKMILGMKRSVWSHPRAKLYLSNGKAEQSIFVKDPETGLMLKGRPDFLPNNNSNLIVDLKTALDASREGFQKAIGRYGYFRQAAYYKMLANSVGTLSPRSVFAIIAVEKKPPYATNVFLIPDNAIEAGEREYRALLNKLADAISKNDFPCCEPEEIVADNIPEFYLKQK